MALCLNYPNIIQMHCERLFATDDNVTEFINVSMLTNYTNATHVIENKEQSN